MVCFHDTCACLVLVPEHSTMFAEGFWHVQVEMHAHWRNDRLLKWCNQQGIHVSAYGPLSSPQTMEGMGKDVPNLMEVSYAALPLRNAADMLATCASDGLLLTGRTIIMLKLPRNWLRKTTD